MGCSQVTPFLAASEILAVLEIFSYRPATVPPPLTYKHQCRWSNDPSGVTEQCLWRWAKRQTARRA
jgi:hypothetical protein